MTLKSEIEELIFEVKAANFVAEHNMVHTATLEYLKEKFLSAFKRAIEAAEPKNHPHFRKERLFWEKGVREYKENLLKEL